MNKCLLGLTTVAALCTSVFAGETKADTKVAEAEKGEFAVSDVVSAEFSIAVDSKFVSYGLIDNKDPIVTPGASLTFFDWVSFGVSAIYDTSAYGKKAGYGDRKAKYIELDPEASIGHSFSPDDFEWLPTTVELSFGYVYEYHPREMARHGDAGCDDHTQFVCFELALPDLWIEPAFAYERDIMRDDGSYFNLSVGHTFPIIEDVLDFRASVAQGMGNAQRVKGYLSDRNGNPLDRNGLMDTCFMGELSWNITDWLALSSYIAYYDYFFGGSIRDAADTYEATGSDDKGNFVCGLALTASF